MTRYEQLIYKSNKLLDCAKNTTGKMREIWLGHYNALLEIMNNLTVEEARQIVD